MNEHVRCETFLELVNECKEHKCDKKHIIDNDQSRMLRFSFICVGCGKSWSVRANQLFEYAKTLPEDEANNLRHLFSSDGGRKIFAEKAFNIGLDTQHFDTKDEILDEEQREKEKWQAEQLATAQAFADTINIFIKNGKSVTVLPADDLKNGYLGFIIFTEDEKKQELASYPVFPFRPKVSKIVECNSRSEYSEYKEIAREKKWIVQSLDNPLRLTLGFTVQNSDGVTLYTIGLSKYKTVDKNIDKNSSETIDREIFDAIGEAVSKKENDHGTK